MKKKEVPRPTESNPEIFVAAIDLLMPSIWDWVTATSEQENYPNDEREHVRSELIEGIGRNSFIKDGYQLARKMEHSAMWEPDSELVDILDSYGRFLSQAHRDSVKAWVTENNIIPQKKIGDAVFVSVLGVEYEGFILSVDNLTAQYSINIPSLGHLMYTFADGVATRADDRRSGTNSVVKPAEEIDD